MSDIHTKEQRSYNMSRIKSANTKPEMLVRRFLHANGFRYKLQDKTLPGTPDLVLPKYKTVIFIHGCFWHNHQNCKYAKFPESNSRYWTPKLINNVKKDKDVTAALKKEGWYIITIWECKLKKTKLGKTLTLLLKKLDCNFVDKKTFARESIM